MKLLILLALTTSYHIYATDYASGLQLQDNVALGVQQGAGMLPRGNYAPPNQEVANILAWDSLRKSQQVCEACSLSDARTHKHYRGTCCYNPKDEIVRK